MQNRSRQKNKKTYYFKQDNYAHTHLSLRERLANKQRRRYRIITASVISFAVIMLCLIGYLYKNNLIGSDGIITISAGGKEKAPMNDSELYSYLRPGQENLELAITEDQNKDKTNSANQSSKNETGSLDVFNSKTLNENTVGADVKQEVSGSGNTKTSKASKNSSNDKSKSKSTTKDSNQPVDKKNKDYKYIVEETAKVENSYFSDAVFIGDSRTEGLFINTGLTKATFYAHKGLSVDKIFTEKVVTLNNKKVTVFDALKKKKYSKVYIMFGVNELGWPYDNVFKEKFQKMVQKVKELQPDAIIYIQEIMPVTAEKDAQKDVFTNKKIKRFNKVIREVVREEGVYYLAVADAVKDTKGALPKDASTDGVHLTKSYYIKWLDYLKKHVVQ